MCTQRHTECSNKTRNEFLRKCEIEIKTVSAESTKQQRGNIQCECIVQTY